MDVQLIPNLALTHRDIPSCSPSILDPVGYNTMDGPDYGVWDSIWRFALTFDGYSYFGGDPAAPERLFAFNSSIKDAQRAGSLPDLDLAQLRACLFVEQRAACKWSGTDTTCPRDTARYLDALLTAIRRDITC